MERQTSETTSKTAEGEGITGRDLKGWRLVGAFCGHLEKALGAHQAGKRASHGLRKLDARRYLGLFLLGLFNPIITSMRGLCAVSGLERVGREVCGQKVALSRFSDAQEVFDPELLRRVFETLLERRVKASGLAGGGGHRGGVDPALLRVVDSTLWKVIPRMGWAQWRFQRTGQQALRLHVKLRVATGVGEGAEAAWPAGARVTSGKGCERAALRAMMEPGEIYLGDRYFGEDYAMLESLAEAGCGFLLRLRNNAVLRWENEDGRGDAPPGAEAHAACIADEDPIACDAHVARDARARLGDRPAGRAWRIVRIEPPGREPVTLVASSEFDAMSAHEIGELYRKRWQVEGFFKWLKCLLPCRHWFAHSERGVNLQIYLSLISALLLAEATGRLPGKRIMELLHWHQMGVASDEELTAGLTHHAREAARKRQLAQARKQTPEKQN